MIETASEGTADGPHGHTQEHPTGRRLFGLCMAALGVVYGDIGTSPLYAVRECFTGPHKVDVVASNILGVLSLIFWALVLVVTVKYHVYVLRADNRGEGGIMALMALVRGKVDGRARTAVLWLGLFGAALLYADGVLTPAISVLGAIEGLEVLNPLFGQYVVPFSVVILIGLFFFQSRGTAGIGAIFGPVILVWFSTLALLGIASISRHPSVLAAVDPRHAWRFFADNGVPGFLVLGAVFLVATGGEALYADLGHFGERPIQLDWFCLVGPSLLLNYFGQGALLLSEPQAAQNPFYLLAPEWGRYPLLVLATMAAIIASQAIISGAFSVTRQAVQLGYLPRVAVTHTSESQIGQIYVPAVNWLLMVATIGVVVGFRSSSNVASAYGVALTTTMLITTLLAFVVTRRLWGWSLWLAGTVTATFMVLDLAFFGATMVKVFAGGWFPLAVGAAILLVMTTWQRGRELLAERIQEGIVPLEDFFELMHVEPTTRVPGAAVFMASNPEGTPLALMNNFLHNHTVHERVVLLTIQTEEVPYVDEEKRVTVKPLRDGFVRFIARYGFMESPDVMALLKRQETPLPSLEYTTFILGHETVIAEGGSSLWSWRAILFAFLSRNATRPTTYFNIPSRRVLEIGTQISI
ncbi:MAG: potassium transporter Kup [Candidatus Wallbacteria bacterium]|nr:potassium transporter Kup [Candidatus Wallbacteria bacterium]